MDFDSQRVPTYLIDLGVDLANYLTEHPDWGAFRRTLGEGNLLDSDLEGLVCSTVDLEVKRLCLVLRRFNLAERMMVGRRAEFMVWAKTLPGSVSESESQYALRVRPGIGDRPPECNHVNGLDRCIRAAGHTGNHGNDLTGWRSP